MVLWPLLMKFDNQMSYHLPLQSTAPARFRIILAANIRPVFATIKRIATIMIEIAEVLPTSPTRLWTLVQQVGVTHAVGGLPWDERGNEQPWDYMPLLRMKQRYENAGFTAFGD